MEGELKENLVDPALTISNKMLNNELEEFTEIRSLKKTISLLESNSYSSFEEQYSRVTTIEIKNSPFLQICFTLDGQYLVSASDSDLSLIDYNSNSIYKSYSCSSQITSIALTRDGKYVLAGLEGEVLLLEINELTVEFSYSFGSDLIFYIGVSPDGTTFAAGDVNGSIKVFDLVKKIELISYNNHSGKISGLNYSFNGKFLLSSSYDKTALVWNIYNNYEEFTIKEFMNSLNSACFSPDGKHIIIGTFPCIFVISFLTRELECKLVGYTDSVVSLHFSQNSKYLITASEDRLIKVWEFDSKLDLFSVKGHSENLTYCCCHPTELIIASSSTDGVIKLWDFTQAAEEFKIKAHYEELWSLCFTPDNRYLATGDSNGNIKIWDMISKEIYTEINFFSSRIWSIIISSDGKYMIAGGENCLICYWDIEDNFEQIYSSFHK